METEILDDNTTQKIRNIEYATFLDRFLAAILDSIIKMVALGYLCVGNNRTKMCLRKMRILGQIIGQR